MFRRKFAEISLIAWFLCWSVWALATLGVGGFLTMTFMMATPTLLAIVATEERFKQ